VSSNEHILVIKLGALGDFIQALGPMAAIRHHHPQARVTLLTTKPFEGFARQTNYFDDIWIDERPKLFNISGWLALKDKLDAARFTRVYDLQNNNRTSFYLKLFQRKPEWVGAAWGASHRNNSPSRTAGHAFEGHVQTLALAGIKDIKPDTLEWMQANISSFPLKKPYVLLVPGSAPDRPQKRWPAEYYARLALMLMQWGYQPVIIGTASDEDAVKKILQSCPQALDLCGQTTLAQVATLARGAAVAIGNDTGPMHLIAATSCPCLVLFSRESDPAKHAPQGGKVHILQKDILNELEPETVLQKFQPRNAAKKLSGTMH
jgi:ADP-heptose:LPS heptosyltransferase